MLYLEVRRDKFDLTQSKLGDKTGISQRLISQFEREESWPTPAQLQRLAKVLHLPPDLVMKTVELTPKDAPTVPEFRAAEEHA